MKATELKTDVEEIQEAECLEILGRHSLGRIAIVVDGQPQIFPVNYAMSGRIIAIRTASGSKLSQAPDSKVSFEIDEHDASAGVAWSVMVQGVAIDATEAFDDGYHQGSASTGSRFARRRSRAAGSARVPVETRNVVEADSVVWGDRCDRRRFCA
jgi:nitroimidazol reductase NimA-like FMN-containing flavoprotein (pyridoxamine 5'-phosphate oxidase superfamily)